MFPRGGAGDPRPGWLRAHARGGRKCGDARRSIQRRRRAWGRSCIGASRLVRCGSWLLAQMARDEVAHTATAGEEHLLDVVFADGVARCDLVERFVEPIEAADGLAAVASELADRGRDGEL